MVREDDMLDVARGIARHVAGYAIIAIGQARRLRSAAIGGRVATQALAAKVRGLRIGGRNGMRIKASTAP
jgi:hypothetical protein